jgi:hypothetical protein
MRQTDETGIVIGQGLAITGKLDAKTQNKIDQVVELEERYKLAKAKNDKFELFALAEEWRKRGKRAKANQMMREAYEV